MRTCTVVVGMIFCVPLAACGDESAETGPVKVGLLAPKTGALTQGGLSFERVAMTAVASINDKGGIGGRELELLVADTQTMGDTAGAKLQGLIDQGAIAVVGPATSGGVTNAWPVAKANGVPLISPSSSAPGLSRPAPTGPDDDGYMFRNVPDDEIQSVAMAYYLRRERSPVVPSVAIVYESTPYGSGLKDAFRNAFLNLGGTVSAEITYNQNLADTAAARPVIDALAALDPDPEMVVMIAVEGDAVKLVNTWHDGGSPVVPGMQWFMSHGARTSGFLTAAPATVRGMCGTAPTFPINGLAYRALKDAYESSHPGDRVDLQAYAPNVWDAYHLIAAALVLQANQYRGEPLGGEHLRDSITSVSKTGQTFRADQWRDLVTAIRGGNDIDYDGAAGPNDLDVVGQAVGPYEVWCVAADGLSFEQSLFLDAEDIQMLRGGT